MKSTLLVAGLAAVIAASTAQAQNISVQTNIRTTNQYTNSRGFVALAAPSAQPNADLTMKFGANSIDVGYWGNYSLANVTKNGREIHPWDNTEQDVMLSFKHDLGPLSAKLGWNKYWLGAIYEEAAITITANNAWHPTLFAINDFRSGNGQYAELSVSPRIDLSRQVSLDASVAALFNNHYAVSSSGMSGIRTKVAATAKITPNFSISADARYFRALHRDFNSNWGFGVTFAASK